jgi:hypothetical protein
MKKDKAHLYAKDTQQLQIPYAEYKDLMDKVEQARRLNETRSHVLANLKSFPNGNRGTENQPVSAVTEKSLPIEAAAPAKPEKVSVEFSAEEPERAVEEVGQEAPVRVPDLSADIPPIKSEITDHFNKTDASGRLLNVFKQYYTCINAACGGTVRVTLKDGFCSLWNYDEWEEFAYVDIFDNHLRIAINPRYTDELKSLKLCEVPRLLSSRHDLICVQVDDLNNMVLDVLNKSFREAGTVAR